MSKAIALDFDGVLHEYDTWTGIKPEGKPIEGSREAVESLLDAGWTVFIHSTRAADSDGLGAMLDWFREHEFPLSRMMVTAIKPKAEVYVDDRGLRFESWEQALEAIEALGTTGEEESVDVLVTDEKVTSTLCFNLAEAVVGQLVRVYPSRMSVFRLAPVDRISAGLVDVDGVSYYVDTGQPYGMPADSAFVEAAREGDQCA